MAKTKKAPKRVLFAMPFAHFMPCAEGMFVADAGRPEVARDRRETACQRTREARTAYGFAG